MITCVLGEGQYELPEPALAWLHELDAETRADSRTGPATRGRSLVRGQKTPLLGTVPAQPLPRTSYVVPRVGRTNRRVGVRSLEGGLHA